MAKFQFPQNPGTNRPNPFQDAAGKNPFGDPGALVPKAPASESTSSPYQAGQGGEERPYRPGDYQPMLPHRGGTVLAFGVSAFVLQAIGTIVELIAAFATSELLFGLVLALPLQLLGLALGIPACIFGRNDSRAMAAGAMQPGGETQTRVGFRLAMISVVLGSFLVIHYLVLLILDAIGIAVNWFGF